MKKSEVLEILNTIPEETSPTYLTELFRSIADDASPTILTEARKKSIDSGLKDIEEGRWVDDDVVTTITEQWLKN